jgi:hypothetical protein
VNAILGLCPLFDEGPFKGGSHLSETSGRVGARVNPFNGDLRFAENLAGPQWAVQLIFGDAQQSVS